MLTTSNALGSLVLILLVATLGGCGGSDGARRFSLAGTVHLASGKPVPAGEVQFEPDGAAGNKGPASTAQIKDGKYSVSADQGVVGGKYIVTILAFDGVAAGESLQGMPLIKAPYVEKLDLPQQDSTKDFKLKE